MNEKEQHESIIKDFLLKSYHDSSKQLYDSCNYVGFGILIAIFFMNKKFRWRNKCLILFSSVLSILTLFLNYFLSAYSLKFSHDMLSNINQNGRDAEYRRIENCFTYLSWTTQLLLVATVIFFCILGYKYFFDADSNNRKNKAPHRI